MNKAIITAAITGAVHTPSLSPYFPYTPDQIVAQAIEAAKAGATVLHVHAREEDGRPTSDPVLYKDILSRISAQCDAVICMTSGGSVHHGIEERVKPISTLRPELASLNSGSMNFSFHLLANKVKEWKFDWEEQYLRATEDVVFSNTFKNLGIYGKAMTEAGVRPELEVYDAGQINNIKFMVDSNVLKAPVYLQFVLGVLGGLPATADNLVFLVDSARRAFGEGNFFWSCCATGKSQLPMIAIALAMGGNCRVGLEDNLYIGPGRLAKSSAEQVGAAIRIAKELGREIATPDEARSILGLKGKKNTGWAS